MRTQSLLSSRCYSVEETLQVPLLQELAGTRKESGKLYLVINVPD